MFHKPKLLLTYATFNNIYIFILDAILLTKYMPQIL